MRIFLTGASSGIGAALARHYAAAGATLGLAARRQDRLAELAAALPGTHACYPLDVADAAALQAAAADFIARCGCPDIVIANAGVSVGTLAEEADDLAALHRVFQTNVMGMAQTFQPFIAAMKARGSGRLVGLHRWLASAACRERAPTPPPRRRPSPGWKPCVANCAAVASRWSRLCLATSRRR